MPSDIEQAVAHQKAGRLAEAEEIYRRLLVAQPEHPEALHWLGVLSLQRNDPGTAVALIGRALERQPNYLEAQSNLGLALHAHGRFAESVAAYRRALALAPQDVSVQVNLALALGALGKRAEAIETLERVLSEETHFEALCALGDLYVQAGRPDAAADQYRQAARLQPDSAAAQYNLGRALQLRGELPPAIEAYRRAVSLNPRLAPAHNNLGAAFAARGDLDEAISAYRQAVALRPDYADAYNNLGLAFQAQEKPAQAEAAFRGSLAHNAADADVHNNLGLVLALQGRSEEALAAFAAALALDPSLAVAHNNLGNLYAAHKETRLAIAAFERALGLKPDYADAYSNLGNALAEEGRLSDAVAAYDKALALVPDFARTHGNRAVALLRQGQITEALATFRQALALEPGYAEGHSSLFQAMHYSPELDRETIFAEARRWNQVHAVPLATQLRRHENSRDPDRRLRLGYVSADFRRHPVGWFFRPVFAHHNRAQFELFCYSGITRADDFTEAFRARADRWHKTLGVSDSDLAQQIRSDAIDILIDLSGHTRGHRLLAFARKPAPVQVTAGGHYDTTGMDTIDYLIADRFHAPPGAERYFSEALIRLPHDYICYRPPEDAPPVRESPARALGYVTFGCFNNLSKLNDAVISPWVRILKHLPTSRLHLQTRELNDIPTRERLRAVFAERGIPSERLRFAGGVPHLELLAAYNEIDIALDPFPYSGGLTTCEALWMGVPVITLTGQNFCGRHSTSHLMNVGLPELVTTTPEDYVQAALALARDPERFGALREGLRERMAASPLCDAKGYTRDLEATYREMWENHCNASSK